MEISPAAAVPPVRPPQHADDPLDLGLSASQHLVVLAAVTLAERRVRGGCNCGCHACKIGAHCGIHSSGCHEGC